MCSHNILRIKNSTNSFFSYSIDLDLTIETVLTVYSEKKDSNRHTNRYADDNKNNDNSCDFFLFDSRT